MLHKYTHSCVFCCKMIFPQAFHWHSIRISDSGSFFCQRYAKEPWISPPPSRANLTPGFGPKNTIWFTQMNAEHSCNCIFSMVNDSFACNHYHFMKMSNVDRFIECIWHKHRKNLDFTPRFGAEMQFNLLKCTPNPHVTASLYRCMIVTPAITIPSWKWVI